ncbi:Hrf1 family-containing protein [Strongyloides ratti]|uniref:Protein YIF1 n=1 Tax=Strongyloides ratti TaxID=34506 RepID=A0A090L574_STRRB|nr:Hrf1 family-containing protein [Strongyloides ratti]CEF63232.1 Hrf1 family-containing protein [Strongyloides ratti]
MSSNNWSNMDWSYDSNTGNQWQNQNNFPSQQYSQHDVSMEGYNLYSQTNDNSIHGNQQQYNEHQIPNSYSSYNQQDGGAFNSFVNQPMNVNHRSGNPNNMHSQMNGNNFGMGNQNFMSDPLFNAAQQFGGQFAAQQKEKISQYISSFQLKYYFAVSNSYVAKKLGIILLPFIHKNWSIQVGVDGQPVTPKEDVNAPDLYIPLMAFITYVLLSGLVLGIQQRFSPEQLGVTASNVFIYLFLENIIIVVSRYVMNLSNALGFWHSLAYSSYKYVGMVVSLLGYLIFGKSVYNFVLLYCAIAIVFFLLRAVKCFIMDSPNYYDENDRKKRKLYLILFITFTQPLIMWWLTSSVTSYMPDSYDFAKMAMKGMGLGNQPVPIDSNGEVDYEALLKAP